MLYDKTVSVTELNSIIKSLLEGEPFLSDVFVRGEISNFKAHSSGHFYFSLKDEGGILKSVMFRSSAVNLPFLPENGMKVVAHGRISSYVRDGQYQLYADSMEPDGIGSLYVAFEQLKSKLSKEGLFDENRKKAIPKIPRRVGVITSPTGAAVRDIINVTGRRFPYAEIVIYPSLVQGPDAALSLCNGVQYFNEKNNVDTIIIGRGGGSLEDLWAFNDEMLARTISASDIPIISAVGHETDFTICDFVSDMRAPTPSAAAEIAVPDMQELKRKINNIISRESSVLSLKIDSYRKRLSLIKNSRVLLSPMNMIDDKNLSVLELSKKLDNLIDLSISEKRHKLSAAVGQLNALNPLSIFSRGYSAIFDDTGSVVKSIKDVNVGETVDLKVSDGTIKANVISVVEVN